jgi:hypothetical protein
MNGVSSISAIGLKAILEVKLTKIKVKKERKKLA